MSRVDAATAAEILGVLARYAQVVDNRDWDHAHTVFAPDLVLGAGPGAVHGVDGLKTAIATVQPYHPHYTTDTILDRQPDGTVRAWSKYMIIRTDGSAGSGDYQDALVHTPAGWRIANRNVSRGNRSDDDPGGPSTRTFDFASWLPS
jgi:3-phenylpropionate/cinnamic acid dioxygenase small subunit